MKVFTMPQHYNDAQTGTPCVTAANSLSLCRIGSLRVKIRLVPRLFSAFVHIFHHYLKEILDYVTK